MRKGQRMNKEKQIEEKHELSVSIYNVGCGLNLKYCDDIAETLYRKGYKKQSEGCGYCGIPLYVKTIQCAMPAVAPMTKADELRQQLLNLTGEVYVLVEAQFCPFCGKKKNS